MGADQHRASDPRGQDTRSNRKRPMSTDYDSELRLYNEVLRRACGVQPRDHVLDIGCGTGQTTRDAARTARAGSAHGIDLSAAAVERAGELARAEGLDNVTFERADARLHRFTQGHFDLAISRFGTMFFDEPVAAFANIRRALRRSGRLVMMVWQAREHNKWEVATRQALTGPEASMAVPSAGPDPFSLADPVTVKRILTEAGFVGITLTDVREPISYGPDVNRALDWVCGFTSTTEALKRLDPAAATRALERLREALSTHMSGDGVWFDSRAWCVTARQREEP
ncbi:class I SAM-dependent methyltransferase [Actinoallomurus iriomotensis]|nr:class I SAM-dependent methyltransferase [Actinoallomurus iriomotensis]